MKHFLALCLALLALCGTPLRAQATPDITGTYQSNIILPGGKKLRDIVKISKDGGTLKGVFYSIDQSPNPFPINTISVQGSTLKFALTQFDLSFEGRISPDGSTITGTSNQGTLTWPENLVRATPETAWTIPEPPAKVPPMAATANPAFEVATIKPSEPGARGKGFGINAHHVSAINTSLSDLIQFAYDVNEKQILNLPEWASTDHYRISGTPDADGNPNLKQAKLMFQKLLKERFQLAFHQDQKELSVFALQLGKPPLKLVKNDSDTSGLSDILFRPAKNGGIYLPGNHVLLKDFTDALQQTFMDRPVIDQTGLPGRYDFTLTFTPDDTMMGALGGRPPAPADSAETAPSLFDALQQQMGLKLEATKAPVKVLIVDKAEKPSAN